MQRLILFAWLLLSLTSCQEKPLAAEQYFPDQTVLFLGNSITQNGAYVSFIQHFLAETHPEWETDIVSIGLSSETVSCLTENDHPFPRPCLRERLDRALNVTNPDVVVACYGMNDGIYHPPGKERMEAYQDGIQHLIKKVHAAGARLILLTPPPFDPLPISDRLVSIEAPDFGYATPYEDYDEVLSGYSQWLLSLDNNRDIEVIDWHTAINEKLAEMRRKNSEAGFAGDGIHPNMEGHLYMAKVFMRAFGMDQPAIQDARWDRLAQDPGFQRRYDQRQMRSAATLGYVGYTRGETVATISPKPLLILMGGQSNMVGSGRKEDLEKTHLPNQIKYINFGLGANLRQNDQRFGPEVGLSRVLAKAYPEQPIILLKYAVGGSSLLDWAPDYSPEKAEITGNARFGNLYEQFFEKIDSVLQLYDPEITALLWMQGERDARIPEAGEEYEQNLTKLITTFRRRLGEEALPFVMGIVNPPATRYPALETVQTAQRAAARELPEVYIVETDDLSKLSDEVHYDSKGQMELGRRYGALLKNLITDY